MNAPSDSSEKHADENKSAETTEKGNGTEGKKPGKLPLIVLACVGVVLAVWLLVHYLSTRNLVSTDDAQTDGNAVTIAPKVSGYVTELAVTDNQRVKAGTLLFHIDPRDYIAARDQAKGALALAQATQANAEANLEIMQVSAPAKLSQARAQREAASVTRAHALADFRRQNAVDPRSTTQQNIDQASSTYSSADATFINDQAQVDVAALVPQNIAQAKAQLDEASAQVVEARAQLATAELNLGYTEVRAPQDGWVTMRNVQQGSYVTAGQTAFSLVAANIWVTANFKENQLDRMRTGQKVTIEVDAYPQLKLEGHVDSLQMGTGSRFSAFPAENATGNFVKIVQRIPVKIVIDRGLDPQVGLPLGLSVDPTVDLQ